MEQKKTNVRSQNEISERTRVESSERQSHSFDSRFLKSFFLASSGWSTSSVGLPNSEGTKIWTPASLAALANADWLANASGPTPRVETTTSVLLRADERDDGEE